MLSSLKRDSCCRQVRGRGFRLLVQAVLENQSALRHMRRTEVSQPRPPTPLVSVIMVHHNQPGLLAEALAGFSCEKPNTEFLVVNTSPQAALRNLPRRCAVIEADVDGYGAAANLALQTARGEFLAVCNADIAASDFVIDRCVDFLREQDDVGIVAPRLLNADGSSQHSARRFYTWPDALWARFPLRGVLKTPSFFARHLMKGQPLDGPRDIDWTIGAMFVVRRAALASPERIFDPRYRMYMEDVDLCLDMWRRGWRVVQLPRLAVVHAHGRASRRLLSRACFHHAGSFFKFVIKHGGLPRRTA